MATIRVALSCAPFELEGTPTPLSSELSFCGWGEWGRGQWSERPPASMCLQGELNGQKGLVPSNFLEEVPDDVEVYLSDAPSPHAQDTPVRSKAKRVSSRPQRVSRPCHCHLRSHAVCC